MIIASKNPPFHNISSTYHEIKEILFVNRPCEDAQLISVFFKRINRSKDFLIEIKFKATTAVQIF